MSLLNRRLLVVTGKGGVGKSTLSATLALAAARSGRRVLVCEVNTRERISALLGAPPVGPQLRPIAKRIDAVVLEPQVAMREYGMMHVRTRWLYQAVFENRWVASLLRFIPSLPELVMLGKALHHVREEKWDLVILDAPATGHGLTFLGVPQALLEALPSGGLRSEAQWMHDLLVDPRRSGVALVALPEEMVINETFELAEALSEKLQMRPAQLFLNRFVSPRFEAEEVAALADLSEPPALLAAAKAAQLHHDRALRAATYRKSAEQRLGLPLSTIPLIYEGVGREALEAIASELEGQL